MNAPRPDPVLAARAATIVARENVTRMEAERQEAAERMSAIAAAAKVSRDDLLARENAQRRLRQLEGEQEQAAHELSAALASEAAAVRVADGVRVIRGNLSGPGDMAGRSSIILVDDRRPGQAGPPLAPDGTRARVLAGLGVQCVTPDDGPTGEVLSFVDVRPDHPVRQVRLLQRPAAFGSNGSEGAQLSVGAKAPGSRSAVAGTTVRSMRLLSGPAGLIGLLIESDNGGQQIVPRWNVAHAVLEADEPGTHFLTLGAATAVHLEPGTPIGRWAAKGEPLPATRVVKLEAREGRVFTLGGGALTLDVLEPAQEVEMETCGELGVALTWRGQTQVVPWWQVRAATVTQCGSR